MTNQITKTTAFKPEASRALNGLTIIYDIGGFSAFFNRPDIHEYIPRYLNHISECLEIMIFGGDTFWEDEEKETMSPLPHLPVHRKFLGDGALYLWCAKKSSDLQPSFVLTVLNRLWNLQSQFIKISKACTDFIPFAELPPNLRFGVARGTVYELSYQRSGGREYIGVCINLASRLQKYCPNLNFIASARVDVPESALERNGFTRVVAKQVKGFPKEIVIVDKNEFKALPPDVAKELFEVIR